jgi:uncharacterized protein
VRKSSAAAHHSVFFKYIMASENDLSILLRTMKPKLHTGDYVFCTISDISVVNISDVILMFKEEESITIIIRKELADSLNLKYTLVVAWITLTVHSSLEAVGLTAAFSSALAGKDISCNVVAAFFHDHIFIGKNDADRAMVILKKLAEEQQV